MTGYWKKIYNLNKAFQYQRPARKSDEADVEEELDFDEEAWQAEQEELRREKLKKYRGSLEILLEKASEEGEISLKGLKEKLTEEEQNILIPDVDIFKEIMVELIKNKEVDIRALRKEQSEFIQDGSAEFQLNEMLLELAGEDEGEKKIQRIETYRIEDGTTVIFDGIENGQGRKKNIRCSNVLIRVIRED